MTPHTQILWQVPAILLLKLSSPRIWIGVMGVGWGLCTVLSVSTSDDRSLSASLIDFVFTCTCKSTAFNFPGLMIARIGIGVFEAGFSPGFPFYLCMSPVASPNGPSS